MEALIMIMLISLAAVIVFGIRSAAEFLQNPTVTRKIPAYFLGVGIAVCLLSILLIILVPMFLKR